MMCDVHGDMAWQSRDDCVGCRAWRLLCMQWGTVRVSFRLFENTLLVTVSLFAVPFPVPRRRAPLGTSRVASPRPSPNEHHGRVWDGPRHVPQRRTMERDEHHVPPPPNHTPPTTHAIQELREEVPRSRRACGGAAVRSKYALFDPSRSTAFRRRRLRRSGRPSKA